MTTVFIDTSVVMYAAGRAHPHRDACRSVMQAVAEGRLDAVTSTEVIQEILHRFGRGRREIGVRMAASTMTVFGDLLPVDGQVMQEAVRQYEALPDLSARDTLHVATCVVHGIDRIVSVDTDFDGLEAVTRVDPADLAGTEGDIAGQ